MHSLGTTVNIAFYASDVGIPHSVGSSMRMAYVVTKMNALTTNITFSHLDTSSKCIRISLFFNKSIARYARNIDILTENFSDCKQKLKFFEFLKIFISFFKKNSYNTIIYVLS